MALPALRTNYINYGNGSSTGYYAATAWSTGSVKAVGALVRQSAAPSVGNERVFVCVVAGTTHASTEPTWTVTRGAKNTDNTVTWQECTGQPATNGDMTNTIRWSTVKNTSVSLGVIIKDSGTNLFICTTAGTAGNGSEPSWSTTVGNTTGDNTVTWTCISNAAFSAWAAPHARLASALAANWGAAGDDFYVGDNHAETQASSMTTKTPGSAASPCRILCVNHSGSMPPVSADLLTTATISSTAAASSSPGINGFGAYCYGIQFQAGTGSSSAGITLSADGGTFGWYFDNCVFKIVSTSSSAQIILPNAGANAFATFKSCTFNFSNASQGLQLGGCRTKLIGGSLAGTVPTTFLAAQSISGPPTQVIGMDLSTLAGSSNLVSISGTGPGDVEFIDCKLGASVTVTTGSVSTPGSTTVRLVNCDSANTNYRYHKQTYQGTISQETTIVANATDGTTKRSLKMVSTANSKFYSPLESDWMLFWNTSTGGALTVAIPVVTDNVTLKDNDAWIEVEGLGTASFPLGTFSTDAPADVLNAGTNQTTDATTSWTTTGLVTPVKQVLSTTITPQSAGFIRARVCLAKASTTMYFDPAPVNGSYTLYKATQYMAAGADGMFGEQAAGGGVAKFAGDGGGFVG